MVYPLCMLRQLDFLRWTSFASVLSSLYLLVFLVVMAGISPSAFGVLPVGSGLAVMKAFPIITTTLIFQQQMGPLRAELVNPTAKRTLQMAGVSILISLVQYSALGVAGYVLTSPDTPQNILSFFQSSDVPAIVARGVMLIIITAIYPLTQFTARGSACSLLTRAFPRANPTLLHYLMPVVHLGAGYAVSASGVDLGLVLALIGATVGQLITALPALFYLALGPREPLWRALSIVQVLSCLAFCVLGMYATLGV